MGFDKYYLSVSAIFNAILLLSTNYIYKELDGHLNTKEALNFSLYVKHFDGLVFYGVDSNNKFLIEFKSEFEEKMISIKYNKYNTVGKISSICNCSICSNMYITIILHLVQSLVVVNCGNKKHSLLIDKISQSDNFPNYPLQRYDPSVKPDKVFIWMGNIGPYKDYKNNHFYPLQFSLSGCLNHFYFNGKSITMEKYKNDIAEFEPSCIIRDEETICLEADCRNYKRSFKMFDCNLQILNPRYCNNDLKNFSGNEHTYLRQENSGDSVLLRLNWKQPLEIKDKNYCLMEIRFKDDSLMIIYISQESDVITIGTKGELTDYREIIRTKTEKGLNNILVIEYNTTTVTIRINGGNGIFTYIAPFFTKPVLINIGHCQHTNHYQKFIGMIDFQYDSTQFKIIEDGSTTTILPLTKPKGSLYIVMILVFSILLIFLIILVVIIKRSKMSLQQQTKMTDSDVLMRFEPDRNRNRTPNDYEFETVVIPTVNSCAKEFIEEME